MILTKRIPWNRGINIISEEKKRCSHCKEIKSSEDFNKNRSQFGGLHNLCKLCQNNSSLKYRNSKKGKEKKRNYYQRTKHKALEQSLIRHYGITRKEYDEMRIKQDCLCAICGKHESESNKGLHVDHCHDTQKVRGLLCNSCNLAIGMLKHNSTILYKAIEYLRR